METKIQMACELIERAVELYWRGDSYYAALHLSSAAEEILGKYVELCDKSANATAFKSIREAEASFAALDGQDKDRALEQVHKSMAAGKVAVKHMYGADDTRVRFDAKVEAQRTLHRAGVDYYKLMNYSEYLQATMRDIEPLRRIMSHRSI